MKFIVFTRHPKELVMAHAEMGGFPANRVAQDKEVISPVTAETKVTIV